MEQTYLFQMGKDEFKVLLKEVLKEILSEENMNRKSDETLIDIQEAASILDLAVATIYEKTSERSIPHYKYGKNVKFKRSELMEWVEAGKVKTAADIKQDALNYSTRLPNRVRVR